MEYLAFLQLLLVTPVFSVILVSLGAALFWFIASRMSSEDVDDWAKKHCPDLLSNKQIIWDIASAALNKRIEMENAASEVKSHPTYNARLLSYDALHRRCDKLFKELHGRMTELHDEFRKVGAKHSSYQAKVTEIIAKSNAEVEELAIISEKLEERMRELIG